MIICWNEEIEVVKIMYVTNYWSRGIDNIRTICGECDGQVVWSDEEFLLNNVINMLWESCRECLKYNMFREYCSKFTQVTVCRTKCILAMMWEASSKNIVCLIDMDTLYPLHKGLILSEQSCKPRKMTIIHPQLFG